VSVCLCVCPWIQSVVPNLGAQKRALQAPSNGVPNFSTGRRGFHVTAPRLALLRSKSRRRRAPRPAAGPPTHAIAGTRARAVTMATVRPPSLPESLQAAGNLLCATTLSSLDAAVVTRRRHRVTSFAFPSGGAPAGASLHLRLPLRRRRPGVEYADCIYGTDCADCGLRFPRPPPICAETCNWASDADCNDCSPGSEFRPAVHGRWTGVRTLTGPSSHVVRRQCMYMSCT
jgi:hypothetical protein